MYRLGEDGKVPVTFFCEAGSKISNFLGELAALSRGSFPYRNTNITKHNKERLHMCPTYPSSHLGGVSCIEYLYYLVSCEYL